MKKIKLKGKERTLTCNGRAMITYQRVTGLNPLDIEHHTDEQKAMYDFVMGWCMLPVADQDEVSLDDIMESIDTMQKQVEFSQAVADEINRWFEGKPGDKDETDRHEVEGEKKEKKEPGEPDKYEKND